MLTVLFNLSASFLMKQVKFLLINIHIFLRILLIMTKCVAEQGFNKISLDFL